MSINFQYYFEGGVLIQIFPPLEVEFHGCCVYMLTMATMGICIIFSIYGRRAVSVPIAGNREPALFHHFWQKNHEKNLFFTYEN